MKPPKYELVLQDCDEALKLDSTYVKALNRRAAALEGLNKFKDALRGKSKQLLYIGSAFCLISIVVSQITPLQPSWANSEMIQPRNPLNEY